MHACIRFLAERPKEGLIKNKKVHQTVHTVARQDKNNRTKWMFSTHRIALLYYVLCIVLKWKSFLGWVEGGCKLGNYVLWPIVLFLKPLFAMGCTFLPPLFSVQFERSAVSFICGNLLTISKRSLSWRVPTYTLTSLVFCVKFSTSFHGCHSWEQCTSWFWKFQRNQIKSLCIIWAEECENCFGVIGLLTDGHKENEVIKVDQQKIIRS